MADALADLRQQFTRQAASDARLGERLFAQLDFARGLCELLPAKAAAWGKLVAKAIEAARSAVAAGKPLAAATAAAEDVLAPLAKAAKQYTLHLVGHAHIDMNWMWSWPETVATTNDTFITVLKLMDEFPDFCFTQSQASVYEITRQYNPELFERIRQRVSEGRWEVAAAHWVEGDKNLASGESLARHLLYTRRYMQEHLGLSSADVSIDWEPDTFGHARTIPSIVARGGVRRYYMCRGGSFAKPPVFWWKGPDGSRILVNLEQTWYNDHIGPHAAAALVKFAAKTGLKDWMFVYGVGDHGGGPTRQDLLSAIEMDAWPVFPRFQFATTGRYYDILEAAGDSLPTLEGELNFEFTGCYTSQSAIKKGNRYGECLMEQAEAAAVLAARAVGRAYPSQTLRDAWVKVLFGHFHDILPGSGVRATREYQGGLFQQVSADAGMIKTHSYRDVAAKIDTSFAAAGAAGEMPPGRGLGGGVGRYVEMGAVSTAGHVTAGPRPVVVFNPTAWRRGDVVAATVWDAGASDNFVVRTAAGETLPAQKLASGQYWGHEFVDLAFPASAGALGYAAYAIDRGLCPGHTPAVQIAGDLYGNWGESMRTGAYGFSNEYLDVEFDTVTGGVCKLVDKASGIDLADRANPLGLVEYVLERPRGMTAWVIGDPQRRLCPIELTGLSVDHKGPHLAAVTAKMKVENSDVSVTYTLRAGQPRLDITVRATWVERGGPAVGTPSLLMRFPLALSAAKATYEVPFGTIERPQSQGQEVPSLRFADVTGRAAGNETAGCTILNDCKYGHSLDGSTLRVSLIRSSYEPDPLPEIGEHTIQLAIAPHAGRLGAAEMIKLGAAFNHPLAVVATDAHVGTLPAAAVGVSDCKPACVIVTGVKKAEDDDAVIFRLLETSGRAAVAKVTLDPVLFGKAASAVEVDFLEQPLAANTAKTSGNGFAVNLPPHGIGSVKVTFA